MNKSADPQRQAQAHRLAAELRALQDRLNQTINQLCELVGGHAAADVLDATPPTAGTTSESQLVPSFLMSPAATPFVRNPGTGHVLSPEARFYSNYRKGLVQILQQSQPRQSGSPYSLILNYADFDGDLMSVVVDARSLLEGLFAGKGRLVLMVETGGSAHNALFAKCAWRVGKKWSERTLEMRTNQVSVVTFDLDRIDPAEITGLDLHLIFNPTSRGSIEILRMTASLTVEEAPLAPTTDPLAVSVFESAP